MKQNVILSDFSVEEDWDFIEAIKKTTGVEWELKEYKSNGPISKLNRISKYFIFPAKLFLHRKEYNNMIAWQQFYGLIFAFYCRLFSVKKNFTLVVMTFIYKEKPGIIGYIYKKFVSYIITSKYIDKCIVFSKNEVKYYSDIFSVEASKFEFMPLGIEKIENLQHDDTMSKEKYILSVGRSNRDYNLLISTVKNTFYNLKIITDTLDYSGELPSNIRHYNDVFGTDMYKFLYNCHCVVITLDNENISAGQLVLLQAFQMKKPVIMTESAGIYDYLKNGYNALVVSKEKKDILQAIDSLYNNEELYCRLVENGFKDYIEKYSLIHLGENVGKLYNEIVELSKA